MLQWSRTSDVIGRKPVLLIGLLGITLSMLSFGLSKTFWGLVVRLVLTCENLIDALTVWFLVDVSLDS